ncbi:MAG: M28 family peptidase [Pyrinomonadaceae bacterium]
MKKRTAGGLPSMDAVIALATLSFIILSTFFAVRALQPPRAVPASASPILFSSGRAMKQLEVIARQPHPSGSPAHTEIRDFISHQLEALGLSVDTQSAPGVKNILARLDGTNNTRAVMLVAHYDTVAESPGASDDGSAVVALLETLRALKAGAPLRNDVIVLFTDGEEAGLLGAKAFVYQHPWMKDVGLLLNFEARGTRGPALMFETSYQNGWLIGQFAQAAPYPVANSLSYDLYKFLPNDTDFTVFKDEGIAGLNFAFIDGYAYYHTPLDNLANLDERSLQHQGSYALALTRHFGNLNLAQPGDDHDAVYFDILGSALVHYSVAWVLPLALAVALIFIAVMLYGFRARRLTWPGVAYGFLALLLSMIGATGIVTLLSSIIYAWRGGEQSGARGAVFNSDLYMVSFASLSVVVVATIYQRFRKTVSSSDLTAGAWLWWLLLMALTSLFLQGGSYLFTWSLAFGLIALGFTFTSTGQASNPRARALVHCVCALPGIMLSAPVIYLMFVAFSLRSSGALMLPVVLLLGLLVPLLDLVATPWRWLLPASAALISLGFIIAGSLTA